MPRNTDLRPGPLWRATVVAALGWVTFASAGPAFAARAERALILEATAPRAVGLAVPGMPIGSAGMTLAGAASQSYSTLLLLSGGRRQVFARH